MPGTHKMPKMGHEPKMKHDKPMMGHEPKMGHKPKMEKKIGLKKLAAANEELEYVGPSMVDEIRPKMAHPKMNDEKNFPKMAQDMAKALIPKMDHAKMYKPTKYHDGPKMMKPGMSSLVSRVAKIREDRKLNRKAQTMPLMGHEPKMDHGPKMGHKPKAYHNKK